MPIVIGEAAYRRLGVGTKVISALIGRARALGYPHVAVEEIYDWNEGSRRCFEKLGFTPCGRTKKGVSYRLEL